MNSRKGVASRYFTTSRRRARHEPVSTSDTTSRGRCIAWYDATIATIDTRISDTQ